MAGTERRSAYINVKVKRTTARRYVDEAEVLDDEYDAALREVEAAVARALRADEKGR